MIYQIIYVTTAVTTLDITEHTYVRTIVSRMQLWYR